jgi:hypothetical protein
VVAEGWDRRVGRYGQWRAHSDVLERLISEAGKIAPSISNFAESKNYGKVTDEALDTQNFLRWEIEARAVMQTLAETYGSAFKELYVEYQRMKDEA